MDWCGSRSCGFGGPVFVVLPWRPDPTTTALCQLLPALALTQGFYALHETVVRGEPDDGPDYARIELLVDRCEGAARGCLAWRLGGCL